MKNLVYIFLMFMMFEVQTNASSCIYLSPILFEQKSDSNDEPFSQNNDLRGDFEEKSENEVQLYEEFLTKKSFNYYLTSYELNSLKNSFFYQKSISNPFLKEISHPPNFS